MMMKTTKGGLIFLMVGVMILATAQSTLAGRGGCQAPDPGTMFDLYPKAHGMRVLGIMGIHYEYVSPDCDDSLSCPCLDPDDNPVRCYGDCGREATICVPGGPRPWNAFESGPCVKMTFFMRLDINGESIPFGGVEEAICYQDFPSQQVAIQAFIGSVVIPYLANPGPNIPGYINCAEASFALRDVTRNVDDLDGDFNDGDPPVFTLMNFVLAIDDSSCP
jgi:hypothetical protein